MELLEQAKALRALFSGPETWTKHAMARTQLNHTIAPHMSTAVCWCLIGGVSKICIAKGYDNYNNLFTALEDIIKREYPVKSVTEFNDATERTFSDISAILDTLVSELEGR